MENNLLEIKNLYVNAEDKEILKGINLNIKKYLEKFFLKVKI